MHIHVLRRDIRSSGAAEGRPRVPADLILEALDTLLWRSLLAIGILEAVIHVWVLLLNDGDWALVELHHVLKRLKVGPRLIAEVTEGLLTRGLVRLNLWLPMHIRHLVGSSGHELLELLLPVFLEAELHGCLGACVHLSVFRLSGHVGGMVECFSPDVTVVSVSATVERIRLLDGHLGLSNEAGGRCLRARVVLIDGHLLLEKVAVELVQSVADKHVGDRFGLVFNDVLELVATFLSDGRVFR